MSLRSACFPFPKAWTLGTGRQGWAGGSPMARGQGRAPSAPLHPPRPPGCLQPSYPNLSLYPTTPPQLPRAALLCPISLYGVLGSPVHPNALHATLGCTGSPKHLPQPYKLHIPPRGSPVSPLRPPGCRGQRGRGPGGRGRRFLPWGVLRGQRGAGGSPSMSPLSPRGQRPRSSRCGGGGRSRTPGSPWGCRGGFSAPAGPFPLLLLPNSGPPRPPVLVPVSVPVTLNWSQFPSQ